MKIFEDLNFSTRGNNPRTFHLYNELQNCFVRLLTEIVRSYTYNIEDEEREDLSSKVENLESEKFDLQQKLRIYENRLEERQAEIDHLMKTINSQVEAISDTQADKKSSKIVEVLEKFTQTKESDLRDGNFQKNGFFDIPSSKESEACKTELRALLSNNQLANGNINRSDYSPRNEREDEANRCNNESVLRNSDSSQNFVHQKSAKSPEKGISQNHSRLNEIEEDEVGSIETEHRYADVAAPKFESVHQFNKFKKTHLSTKVDNGSANEVLKDFISGNEKQLTLNQLKSFIEEYYKEKYLHDQKRLKAKLNRETPEEFLLLFLKRKYGLDQLVMEWAVVVVDSVKKYAEEDSDALVFLNV